MSEKKPVTSLFCENEKTSEGKYLVKRRDGTVVEWPSFVLGGKDPEGGNSLRFYADQWEKRMLAGDETVTPEWIASIRRRADQFDKYLAEHGAGDPPMGPHRKDDPTTIEEMRKGMSS